MCFIFVIQIEFVTMVVTEIRNETVKKINAMEQKNYYHMYANGDDASDFIICEEDFYAEFNLVAVCAFNSEATVVAFSLEDTHPHFILYGTHTQCLCFKRMFEQSSLHHILDTRHSLENVVLDCQLDLIDDINHLMNAATYVIVQATKDGKAIMPYDYYWGTGSLYFRSRNNVPIWYVSKDGAISQPQAIGELTLRERRAIKCSRMDVPDSWLVCNGFILPQNYVDIERFEKIYLTHNCFRTFLSSGKTKLNEIQQRMAQSRGVIMEDTELAGICKHECMELFGQESVKMISATQRVQLAQRLRQTYSISFRQLAKFCRLPEYELRKYVT